MPWPWIPPRGKLEKRLSFSPYCGDETTTCSNRAFVKMCVYSLFMWTGPSRKSWKDGGRGMLKRVLRNRILGRGKWAFLERASFSPKAPLFPPKTFVMGAGECPRFDGRAFFRFSGLLPYRFPAKACSSYVAFPHDWRGLKKNAASLKNGDNHL